MDTSTVTCPKCQTAFSLTDAIERPILDRLRAQVSKEADQRAAELSAKERKLGEQAEELRHQKAEADSIVAAKLEEERKRLVADLDKRAREGVAVELKELQDRLSTKEQALAKSQASELELRKAKQKLDDDRASFELEQQRTLDAERQRIRDEATKAATETPSGQLTSLKADIAAKDQRLADAQRQELELRKQRTELEEQKKSFDLEVARKADAVRDEVAKQKDEEFRFKEAENAKKLADMTRQIDELKRKAEQGSQQSQGEILELDLEAALARAFPFDEIRPVRKGQLGADVLHVVRDERAMNCGTMIWESKRTKNWSDGWIQKLKDDKLAAKAQIAVLVSSALPKDMPTFDCRDGVWVVPPVLAMCVATALRRILIDTAGAKRSVEGRHDKMAAVYDYLAGPEFKGRVTAIVESFTAMKADLESEKKAMLRIWAKREKQIERMMTNTVGLHGELQGIIGSSLLALDALELGAIAALPASTDDE